MENIKAKLELSPIYASNVTSDIFNSKLRTVNSPLPAAQNPDPVVARLSAIEDSNVRIEEIACSLHKMMISKSAPISVPALSSISSEDREQAVGATFFRKDTYFGLTKNPGYPMLYSACTVSLRSRDCRQHAYPTATM